MPLIFNRLRERGPKEVYDRKTVGIENVKMMKRVGAFDQTLASATDNYRSEGQTVMFIALDGKPAGMIGVVDPIKATTPEAVDRLHAKNLKVVMLTGDSAGTANAVARPVEIDLLHADVSPEDKLTIIKQLQSSGEIVAMVGDGINDAPALAHADVGLAMRTGIRRSHGERRCNLG